MPFTHLRLSRWLAVVCLGLMLAQAGWAQDRTASVSGHVMQASGAAAAGIRPRAVSRRLGGEETLGEARSDAAGAYRIVYRSPAGEPVLMLQLRALDGSGAMLAQSVPVTQVRTDIVIDLSLPAPPPKHLAVLKPPVASTRALEPLRPVAPASRAATGSANRIDLADLRRRIDAQLAPLAAQPDAEPLWAQVRALVGNLLVEQWRAGRLLGENPAQAFYVRCDLSTMTSADISAGRLVFMVGVATVKPAEFEVLRFEKAVAPGAPP